MRHPYRISSQANQQTKLSEMSRKCQKVNSFLSSEAVGIRNLTSKENINNLQRTTEAAQFERTNADLYNER